MAKIGLQLYTVREDATRDLLGTIAGVGKMGYDGVEFAGVPAIAEDEIKAALVDAGLEVAGVVVPMHEFQDNDAFERAVAFSRTVGSTTVLFPWLNDEFRGSASAYQSTAALLNGFGERCRNNSLTLLYHVHGYEFENYDGRTGLEILMQETDPTLVGLEPDTYWIEHGGVDALQFYLQYADRAPSIHFKDANNRTEWRDVEIGSGIVDTAGILRAAKGKRANWFIVEQEQFDMPPMESASISYKNLKRLVEENYAS